MKKNLIYVMMMSLAFISCQDKRLDGLEPDRIYLPKAGMQVEESYTIGEMAEVQLWTYKSSYTGTSCQVTYTIDPELLTTYNAQNGTSYELLPEMCYNIAQSTIEITDKDEYARFSVSYSPEKIEELCGYNVKKYALPFRISSPQVATTAKNTALLVFQVKEPVIKMASKVGTAVKFNLGETSPQIQTVKFGMDFASVWDCGFKLATDAVDLQQAIDDYNAANEIKYTLLPGEAYELAATEGVITKGMSAYSLSVTVNPADCKPGLYAIPVILSHIDLPLHISEADKVCLIPVICQGGDYLAKTGWTVKVSSVNPNFGKPEYLVDGNITTYWHPAGRDFGQGRDNYPWAVVDMKKTAMVRCFEVDPRQDQFYPQIFSNLRCFVSDDGVTFKQVGYVAVPWTSITKCTIYTAPAMGRYVKFSIDYPTGQTSIAFAELSIRGEYTE